MVADSKPYERYIQEEVFMNISLTVTVKSQQINTTFLSCVWKYIDLFYNMGPKLTIGITLSIAKRSYNLFGLVLDLIQF